MFGPPKVLCHSTTPFSSVFITYKSVSPFPKLSVAPTMQKPPSFVDITFSPISFPVPPYDLKKAF